MKTIPLTQGMIALVDDEDFERLNQYKWQSHFDGTNWYAVRSSPMKDGKRSGIKMHREILGASGKEKVDHKFHDGLFGVVDNRRGNIRIADSKQNGANRKRNRNCPSRFKGVGFQPGLNRWPDCWRARIRFEGKAKYLGIFQTEEDAAVAYDSAARILFGQFAHTNFPYVFIV